MKKGVEQTGWVCCKSSLYLEQTEFSEAGGRTRELNWRTSRIKNSRLGLDQLLDRETDNVAINGELSLLDVLLEVIREGIQLCR